MQETGLDSPPRPIRRVPYWNFLPLVVFIVLNGLILYLYRDEVVRIQEYLTPFAILLMGLATFRIADIIANEQITQAVRAPFINVAKENGEEIEVPKPYGIRQTIGALIYCPSCVGVWVAAGLVYLFVFAPNVAWVVTVIFALSALVEFLSCFTAWLRKLSD